MKADMTKTRLAQEIGVHPSTLRAWQTGRAEIPASKIAALSKVFGVTADYLLGRIAAPKA
jgi:DNA-binding helix-turn-helix protein